MTVLHTIDLQTPVRIVEFIDENTGGDEPATLADACDRFHLTYSAIKSIMDGETVEFNFFGPDYQIYREV
jgi:hypothetical protein